MQVSFAQAPQKMSYQSVIRDASNALVTDAAVGIQISIVQGSPAGAAVFVETHAPVTNANGLASVEIGSGTPITGTIAAIDWSNGPFFIKSETDPSGGTNYTLSGTTELLSVPYALYAANAGGDGSWTISADTVSTDKWVGIGTDSPNSILHVSGSGTEEQGRFETSAPFSKLGFYANGNRTGEIAYGSHLTLGLDNSSNGLLRLQTSGLNRLTIDGEGRSSFRNSLSVGTASPASIPFWVSNDFNATGTNEIARFTSSIPDGSVLFSENNTVRGAFRFIDGDFIMNAPSSNGRLRFLTNSSVRMTIDEDGEVGIGTANPRTKLHIRGGEDASLAANSGFMILGEVISKNLVLDDNEIIARNAGQNDRLYLNAPGGPISFGNSNTTYKFEFSGSSSNYIARFINTSKGGSDGIIIQTGPDDDPDNSNNFIRFRDGDGDDIGSIRGGEGLSMAIVYTSDARLKKNVEPVRAALERIEKMEPVTYEFISADSKRIAGFLAQDLQKVYPEVVSGDPDGDVEVDPMGIDYGMLTPLLTAAIKEQQAIIKEQESRIAALEAGLEKKDETIETLKVQLDDNTVILREIQGFLQAKAQR